MVAETKIALAKSIFLDSLSVFMNNSLTPYAKVSRRVVTMLFASIFVVLASPLVLAANAKRTLRQWHAVIVTDARVASLIRILGKPDSIERNYKEKRGGMDDEQVHVYRWAGAVDDGTNGGGTLQANCFVVSGTPIVAAILIPGGEGIDFDWSPRFYAH